MTIRVGAHKTGTGPIGYAGQVDTLELSHDITVERRADPSATSRWTLDREIRGWSCRCGAAGSGRMTLADHLVIETNAGHPVGVTIHQEEQR